MQAQGPLESLPVVDEAKADWIPGIAGGGCPALRQDHLEVAVLSVEPHFNLDVVTGRHTTILRYGRISNEQLHLSDKNPSAVQVFNDGVNSAGGSSRQEVCFCSPSFPFLPPEQLLGTVEISEDPQVRANGGCLVAAPGASLPHLSGGDSQAGREEDL